MSKSNSLKNKPSQVCRDCNTKKPLKEFRRRTKANGGGHYSSCKACKFLRKPSVNGDQDTVLEFLLNIRRASKNSWPLDHAKKLILGLKKEWELGNNDFKKIFSKYGSGHSHGGCNSILKEAKKAAQAKMTLEEYWEGGRQFSSYAKGDKPAWQKGQN